MTGDPDPAHIREGWAAGGKAPNDQAPNDKVRNGNAPNDKVRIGNAPNDQVLNGQLMRSCGRR